MIIDATDLLLGRMASFAAKKALLGEKVDIINCEKAVVSGSKANVIQNYTEKHHRGNTFKGPFYSRKPNMVVRRTVRGMLPWNTSRGVAAYKNVRCYIGAPAEFKDKKTEIIKDASYKKLPNLKYVYLERICRLLGSKW